MPIWDTLFNTDIVTANGLGSLFEDAAAQPAGQVGLRNTPPELWDVEAASIEQGREVELRSYNDYRELTGFPRATDFDQISSDELVREHAAQALRQGREDGVLRRPVRRGRAHELRAAVADRPDGRAGRLLAGVHQPAAVVPRIYTETTFSPLGMDIIGTTASLAQIVRRNVPAARRRVLRRAHPPRLEARALVVVP